MKLKSPKEKGRRLELFVAAEIRRYGLDDHATRMPLSGAAFGLETDIRTKIPFSIEVKNQETVSLWKWWTQAERARKPFRPPVLMVGGNHRPVLTVMRLDDWLSLLKGINDLQTAVSPEDTPLEPIRLVTEDVKAPVKFEPGFHPVPKPVFKKKKN